MPAASDTTSTLLGNFGQWQLQAMFFIFLSKLPASWFMAAVIYTAQAPYPDEIWCSPPDSLSSQYLSEWINIAHPTHFTHRHRHPIVENCLVFKDIMDNPMQFIGPNKTQTLGINATVVPCEHSSYHPKFDSIISDFDIMCNRRFLLPITQCFHIFGLFCGVIIVFIVLKSSMSPRNVMIVGMLVQIVGGILTGFVKIYEFHLTFRWLTAVGCALMSTCGRTILIDITGGRARTIAIILFDFSWSIGLLFLPIFSLFIDNWGALYIAISTPTILMVLLKRFLPDSPRWMLRNGRVKDAMEIIVAGATENKREIPHDLENLLQHEIDSGLANPPQASWCSIWDGKSQKWYWLAVHCAWVIYMLLISSLVLNIRSYGRDHLSINTIAIAFSGLIGMPIGLYLILYTRRRWLWSGIISITSGVLAHFTWLIPGTLEDSHVVAQDMSIILASSTSLCLLIACTIDLVPPNI